MIPAARISQNGSRAADRVPLTKLYVEITARCNLKCTICLLNSLQGDLGLMTLDTFQALVDQVTALPEPPMLHLQGFGEPTSHPRFIDMLRIAKDAGLKVGITTNGTLLDEEMCEQLVALRLDRLVVSIDGTKPEHYQDIRLGSHLNEVIANMKRLRRVKIRRASRFAPPQVGIAFVAMRRNIEDLPELPDLALRIGATEIIVSNLIPYSRDMESEILYEDTLTMRPQRTSPQRLNLSLPRMDVNAQTLPPFAQVMNSHLSIGFLDAQMGQRESYCRFIKDGYAVIRWDGAVAPCLSLMYTHDEYIHHRRHHVTEHLLGNINERPLAEIWQQPDYRQFRDEVDAFQYSACLSCAGCDYFSHNQQDCMEKSSAPVCGRCLWAHGLIQCP
jgi:MoaA/NifB/PqqE/SkfB family radical SAM enzyme